MIDATYLKAHRTASSLRVKKGSGTPDRAHEGRHGHQAACCGGGSAPAPIADANGRRISFFMTARQVSDYTGAAALHGSLPKAQWMLADRGYDADWFRDALQEKGITPCILGRQIRNRAVKYDKRR
ncbi:transposase [Sphingopyxis sp.]|uniref:transposase n=1 Tax=Sphingopyxis sp. TaxID=1908224 RepID=UPI0025EE7D3D|nr:transposase [Sphingopyxis sp.]